MKKQLVFLLTGILSAGSNYAQNAITAGTLKLTRTFNSIGISLPFTGDDNKNSTVIPEFKKTSDNTWRTGMQLWQTNATTAPGKAYYGSILLLEQNTAYDIRLTLTDGDGGSTVINGTIKTRADNFPAAATLTPTHFVRSGGNDANNGTSVNSAWATLTKAMSSAPSGAIVQVGPGYYKAPGVTRSTPITLMAEFPAVDDNRTLINQNKRTVVEPNVVCSPAGSSGPNPGPWLQVTLTGPGYTGAPSGASYKIWKWAGGGSPQHIGFSTTREGLYQRIGKWDLKGNDMATPEGWTEKLLTNKTYNYGFAVFGSDIYVRLHGDLDPNNYYLCGGGGDGIAVNGDSVRLSGLEIRQFGDAINFYAGSDYGLVDHCLITGAGGGIRFTGIQGPPASYGTNHVIEYNYIHDSSLWTDDPVNKPNISWTFIKGNITNADGTTYGPNRLGAISETSASWGRGDAHQTVLRHNTIDGTFNGIAGYHVGYDRYSAMDKDIHDNLIRRIADDALEPEGDIINWRMWNNRIEDAMVMLSTGPVHYGPVYFFRNQVWAQGTSTGSGGTPAGNFFKYSGSSNPSSRLYIIHNTFWTHHAGSDGAGQYAGGGSNQDMFYLRNNIMRTTRYAFQSPGGAKWNEDYNHFATQDAGRGFSYAGTKYMTNVSGYRTASGQGAKTNTAGDFITISVVDNALTDATNGDLTLKAGSVFINAGMSIPNISDMAGINYCGSAPDMGASEYACLPTDITDELNHRGDIAVFPNPFTETAQLRISTDSNEPLTFTLYDAMGKKVIQLANIQNGEIITRGTLNPGIYFFIVSSEGGYLKNGKVVIQ